MITSDKQVVAAPVRDLVLLPRHKRIIEEARRHPDGVNKSRLTSMSRDSGHNVNVLIKHGWLVSEKRMGPLGFPEYVCKAWDEAVHGPRVVNMESAHAGNSRVNHIDVNAYAETQHEIVRYIYDRKVVRYDELQAIYERDALIYAMMALITKQLITNIGKDRATGIVRYRLDPIYRGQLSNQLKGEA